MALAAGAVLLIAAAVFAVTRLGSGDDSQAGGAETAEAAGLALLEAIENEDVLGMVDLMLPGERETLREPMVEFVDELRRLEVLGDEASLSDMRGVDLVIEDEAVLVEPTNVDDIANLTFGGTITATVEGEQLPIGDLILDNLPEEADLSEADVDSATETLDGVPLTVVQKDGRWYVSVFYTLAEQARRTVPFDSEPAPIPAEGLVPTGGDSPEDAFDTLLDASAALDLGGILAALNPNEFEVVQRYAPIFLADAQAELDAVEVDIRLDDPEYETSIDGDTASISISYLSGQISAEGETVSFAIEDGCATLEVPDEAPVNTCDLETDDPMLDLPPELADTANEALTVVTDAFDGYSNPGILMKRVDGVWYLSPMASGAEQVLAVLRALDREEIEEAISTLGELGSELFEEVGSGDLDVPEMPTAGDDDTAATVVVPVDTAPVEDETDPLDTAPGEGTAPVEEDTDPADECYAERDGTAAAECFARLLEAGDIGPDEVPIYLRAPECGLADAYWGGDFYELSDAEFVAAIEKAAPCFQALVASGEIDELELPPELAKPECLEGRNWYVVDDDEYSDRFFECVYG